MGRRRGRHAPLLAHDVKLSDYADSADGRCVPKFRTHPSRAMPLLAEDPPPLPPEDSPPPTPARPATPATPDDDQRSVQYPEVLFFLLSQHIDPEDVGRFAGTCRAAYSQTQRAELWQGLYARCVSAPGGERDARLPPGLRVRRGELTALRQRVIRALHRLHPPFLAHGERWRLPQLAGWVCVEGWDRRAREGHEYCFKLRRAPPLRPPSDVWANPQDGCVAILAACRERQALRAPCGGLRLAAARVSLHSAAGADASLRLELARAAYAGSAGPPDLAVVLDGVRRLRVVDWWHRDFPTASPPPPARPASPPALPLYWDFFALTTI